MIESFVPVPMLDLDAPVPQMLEQLVGVLKVFDQSLPEQGIEVPKITLEDGIPQRAVLREPLPAEQLAGVPVPETVLLARGRCEFGVVCCHVAVRGERSYWRMGGTSHVQWFHRQPTVRGFHRQPTAPQIQEQTSSSSLRRT